VTIEAVKQGPIKEQPVDVHLTGGLRPYRPCLSMRRVMIAIWGEYGKDWVGQSMTLYLDPAVKFCGETVGGIRISHMTGLDGDRTLMLTTTRSKRAGYTVRPLQVQQTTAEPSVGYDDIMAALANSPDDEAFATLKAQAKAIYKSLAKQKQQQLTAAIKAVESELADVQHEANESA
jgi:hypothetical protein